MIKYNIVPQRQTQRKRKRTSKDISSSEFVTPAKQRKIFDFFKISPKNENGSEPTNVEINGRRRASTASTVSVVSNDVLLINGDDHGESESVASSSSRKFNGTRRMSSTSSASTEISEKSVQKKTAVTINPTKEYEVEYIKDIGNIKNRPQFLVKWKGWTDEWNTWEPMSSVAPLKCFDEFILRSYFEKIDAVSKVKVDLLEFLKEHPEMKTPSLSNDIPDSEIITIVDKIKYTEVYVDLLLLTLEDKNKFRTNSKLINRLTKHSHLLDYIEKRQIQLEGLHDWANYINSQGINMNMIVENVIDFEGPPLNFTYINEYLPMEGVHIPQDPPIGCKCENDCSYQTRKDCCADMSGGKFAYNSKKRIKISPGMPIYECNKTCKCGPECLNRVVQNGQKRSLCIFKTSNGRGWGVKTIKPIFKGQYICQYAGEIITAEEAEYRGKTYDAEGRTYLFDLDINAGPESAPYTIDAAKFGNISHFINHSCEPNAGVWTVWINCLDPDLPTIAFFALSDIAPGEEITFDYLNQHNKDDGKLNDGTELMEAMSCKCGSENCRKFLF